MFFKERNIWMLLLGVWVLVAGCTPDKKERRPNPASQNCIEKGGKILIETRGDRGQYGICVFEDNRRCEEWALMRGDCRVGGLKITGYLTPEGIYCAILGGKVLENETKCQLPSGKTCSTQDLYNGKCS